MIPRDQGESIFKTKALAYIINDIKENFGLSLEDYLKLDYYKKNDLKEISDHLKKLKEEEKTNDK